MWRPQVQVLISSLFNFKQFYTIKKKYYQPQTEIIHIERAQMIASSNVSSTTEPSHNHYTCRQCKQDEWRMCFCDCILNVE